MDNHQPVLEKEWTSAAVQFPPSSEIPNLHMEIVNFHRPIFGTFHSKFLIVDRKICLLGSNNIQVSLSLPGQDDTKFTIHRTTRIWK